MKMFNGLLIKRVFFLAKLQIKVSLQNLFHRIGSIWYRGIYPHVSFDCFLALFSIVSV